MQRHWLPYILIGGTLLLLVIFALVLNPKVVEQITPRTPVAERESKTPAVTEAGYQAAVTAILAQYKTENDAKAAYDSLVLIRVPSQDLSLHFDLVVAFGKLAAGDTADGTARLNVLTSQHTWLAM